MPSFSPNPDSPWGRVLGAALALIAWSVAAPVQAYEDRLTLDLAAQGVLSPDLRVGPQLGASLGLSDAWTLRTGLSYEIGMQTPVSHGLRAHLDVLYLIDIVEWVPFFGLRGGSALDVHPETNLVPFGGVVGGLDHFVSRDAVVGLDVAWTPGLRDGEVEQIVSVALRLSLLFDN